MRSTAASLLRKLAIKPVGGFILPEVDESLYQMARSGEVGTLLTLHTEIKERPGDYGIEPQSASFVLGNIERYLGFCPGLRQAQGLMGIHMNCRRALEAEAYLGEAASAASLLASCQPKTVLLALIEEYMETPDAFEFLAALFQECIVLKCFTVEDFGQKLLRLLVHEMKERRHPLAWLPSELTEIEGGLEPRSYSRYGSSVLYPWLEDDRFEAGNGVSPAGGIVNFDEIFGEKERLQIIGSAAENWVAESNGAVEARLFRADGVLFSETIVSDMILSLGLSCLADCAAEDLTVFEISPNLAASILFSASAHGGAYISGRFAAYGRLGMWRSLGGLAGTSGGEWSAILRAVLECQWFYFTARGTWFQQVAWDFGLIALDPDQQIIAILAATDTD